MADDKHAPVMTTTPPEQLLDRYRDALRERFPLPTPEQLAPRLAPKKKTVTALVLAFAVAGLVWLDPALRTQQFATAIGERTQVQLSDGSAVTLNTDSQLEVAWHLRSRRVELVKGQALFDVAPAQLRPFYVDAGDTTIRVVGTVFDVQHTGDAVAVTVLQGKVAVSNGDAQVLLTPDQHVDSHADALGAMQRVDATTRTAWKDGQLIFDRMPLRDVLAELQRYTQTPLTVDDPELAAQPVSGVFGTDHGDALLGLLPRVLPVALEHTDDGGIRVVPAR